MKVAQKVRETIEIELERMKNDVLYGELVRTYELRLRETALELQAIINNAIANDQKPKEKLN